MTDVITDTTDAERRALKISLRLDAIADNYEAVMPMIREALELGDHLALGYRSPGEYLRDRFGASLSRLPIPVRQAAVKELTDAGLSTRAIASIVGVSQSSVRDDLKVSNSYSPEPEPEYATDEADFIVNRETGEILDDDPKARGEQLARQMHADGSLKAASPRRVIGLDGKSYSRPEPRATPRRTPLPDEARTAGWALRSAVDRLQAIGADDRFNAHKEAVAPHLRSHLTNAIEVCQDLLDRIDNNSGV